MFSVEQMDLAPSKSLALDTLELFTFPSVLTCKLFFRNSRCRGAGFATLIVSFTYFVISGIWMSYKVCYEDYYSYTYQSSQIVCQYRYYILR